MITDDDEYKITIQTYGDLGKRYIENSASIDLFVLNEFMGTLPKGGKVLDVGCVAGRDSKKLAAAGFDVTGIDVVDIFLEEARKNVAGAKFLKMDMLDISFPKNSFDGILAQAVLLHIRRSEVPKVLKDFYKILKPGGKIYVGVKRGDGEGWEADKLANNKKRFFTYFSGEGIARYMKEAGFKVIFLKLFSDYVKRKNTEWIVAWGEKAVADNHG